MFDEEKSPSELDWETYCFERYFAIDLPSGIRPKLEDDDTVLVFPLPTTPATELIVGVFPTPGDKGGTPRILRSEIERFMNLGAGVEKASVETPVDFEKKGYVAFQAVWKDLRSRWWIARLYGRRAARKMLLAHWVGQANDIRAHVLPILISIAPDLREE